MTRVVTAADAVTDESIADDIITGLESAHVVLVCMSQKYYESPYCKKGIHRCFHMYSTSSDTDRDTFCRISKEK